ncbi:hypothetical protein ON010_g15870 [Phytophthora cinnamomi]|nr:hypothetical protein ON010_g15870 [Phytophthora cinnamomi]
MRGVLNGVRAARCSVVAPVEVGESNPGLSWRDTASFSNLALTPQDPPYTTHRPTREHVHRRVPIRLHHDPALRDGGTQTRGALVAALPQLPVRRVPSPVLAALRPAGALGHAHGRQALRVPCARLRQALHYYEQPGAPPPPARRRAAAARLPRAGLQQDVLNAAQAAAPHARAHERAHAALQHIRFGHPLASDAHKLDQSPTSVDADPASLFAWGSDSDSDCSNSSVAAVQVTPIGEDLALDASSEHDVSDEELLEVLSCLLDDEPMPSQEDAPATAVDQATPGELVQGSKSSLRTIGSTGEEGVKMQGQSCGEVQADRSMAKQAATATAPRICKEKATEGVIGATPSCSAAPRLGGGANHRASRRRSGTVHVLRSCLDNQSRAVDQIRANC